MALAPWASLVREAARDLLELGGVQRVQLAWPWAVKSSNTMRLDLSGPLLGSLTEKR
jgi:hypothetical protein